MDFSPLREEGKCFLHTLSKLHFGLKSK